MSELDHHPDRGRGDIVADVRARLVKLALDLRPTARRAERVWSALDGELWNSTLNRWVVLQSVTDARLRELADDPEFMTAVDDLSEQRRAHLAQPRWYESLPDRPAATPLVAYFSMEYMLSPSLQIYSGGLGNVAGDQLKAASDLGVPVIGIGLLYQAGYPRQLIDDEGNQREVTPYNDPLQAPIAPVHDADGRWVRVSVPFAGSPISARVWEVRVGRSRLYLLDTNIPWNRPDVRGVTAELYGGSDEVRLGQEIILGIGGVRLLEKLGLDPLVFHLNEGHAAFAIIERAHRHALRTGTDFWDAYTTARAGNLFTTHTPVSAAFDRFPASLVARYLGRYLEDEVGVDIGPVLALGQNGDHDHFNPAFLAMRGAGAVNGVSRLHGEVSQNLFTPLFPHWPPAEIPIGHVTNGVHVSTWEGPESVRSRRETEREFLHPTPVEQRVDALNSLSPARFWEMRTRSRRALVDYVRGRVSMRAADSGEADHIAHNLFDPDALTIAFARRFATYKRPNLLLSDPERLIALLTDRQRPVQIVVAGKAHAADRAGQAMVRQWVEFSRDPRVRDSVVFLSDYSMSMTQQLVAGVDVWLNNPRRPWEASGTSGMKVLINGGLNLSVSDGWWAEAWEPGVGWVIESDSESEQADDAAAIASIYDMLENEIVPCFYDRDRHGVPLEWVKTMRQSMTMLTGRFSADRTVREYTELHYLPMAQRYLQRAANDDKSGRSLNQWLARVRDGFGRIRLDRPSLAADRQVDVFVHLGDLSPDDIRIELYAEAKDPSDEPHILPMQAAEPLVGSTGGWRYETSIPGHRTPTDYSARVRPWHPELSLPLELALVSWTEPVAGH